MGRTVRVLKGPQGWGGPLLLSPSEKKNKILCVTGGGIHPVAQRLGDLLGIEVVDGFSKGVSDQEVLAVVIDCGGTARAGVYPKKGIPTINILPVGQAGPLARYIKEDLYVSAVDLDQIDLMEEQGIQPESDQEAKQAPGLGQEAFYRPAGGRFSILTKIGRSVGQVVNKFYQAARDAVDLVLNNVIPFMVFVSLFVGLVTKSGLGDWLASTVLPFATSLPGLVAIAFICSIPFLSPILGPGAVIAQVVGVLIGLEIGRGNIPPQFALPALFAIDAQVGADFIPVGLALAEADSKTVEVGVPAILISRMITGPLAVILAYLASFGLYS